MGFLSPWVPIAWLPELQLLSTFLPFLVLVWLIFLWRTWRVRAWKLGLISALGLFLCGWVGAKDLRIGERTESDNMAIRLLSYNVGTFDFDQENMMQVAEILRKHQPDVIAMQEFRNLNTREGQKALDFLAAELDYPYQNFLHLPHHVHGAAFLSKYPILAIDTLFLPKDEINSGILITLDTDLGPVGIANVHFSSFHIQAIYEKAGDIQGKVGGILSRARLALVLQQQKLAAVLAKLSAYPHPVIIAGDLNATPHTRMVRQLSEKYQDSFSVAGKGRGWSFPVLGALGIRIDYQFASPNLRPVSHQVIREKVSDHFPLIVKYEIKN